jgi:hypothetical protein
MGGWTSPRTGTASRRTTATNNVSCDRTAGSVSTGSALQADQRSDIPKRSVRGIQLPW